NEVNIMVHLESLVPKSLKEENFLFHMIYFIWFVVYVHTAGVYVKALLSKLLFTYDGSKNEVILTVYNQSFIWEIFKSRKPINSVIHFYYLSKIHTTDGSHGYGVYQTVAYIVLYQKRGQYDCASRKLSTEIFERRKTFYTI